MKLGIMQPYFLPYVGYFHLISAVDRFVVYDNIKYTKKGWINRNRMLLNGTDAVFTLPLRNAPDSFDVRERELAADFAPDKLLNQIRSAYRRAPRFDATFPLVERIVRHPDRNLFGFLRHSIEQVCGHLGIATPIVVSSTVAIDHGLQAQDKVLALCQALGATTYVNTIGGVELYSRQAFGDRGIELRFIRSLPFEYQQFGGPFVPWLSILDVMMFNAPDAIRTCLTTNYELI